MTAFCGWCGHAAEYQTKQDDQTNTVVKEIVIALPSLLLKSLPGVYQGESVTACFSLFSQRLLHCLTFHEAIFWVVVLDSRRRGCVKAGFSLFKARRPQSWCVEIVQRCRPMTLYEPTTSQKKTKKNICSSVYCHCIITHTAVGRSSSLIRSSSVIIFISFLVVVVGGGSWSLSQLSLGRGRVTHWKSR